MLTTSRIVLPPPTETKLKWAAEFADDISEFARDDLIGFKRPIAATFAFVTPILLAIVFYTHDLSTTIKMAVFFSLMTAGGLALVGRELWPHIVDEFQSRTVAKRRAVADLRCGFGEESHLSLSRAPRYFEYGHGVLVLADAGEWRTAFFSISKDEDDPRWTLYKKGALEREVWRWLRLPVSHEIVRFSAEGAKIEREREPLKITSIDAWEAINVALGEPMDGSVIYQTFDEVADMVEKLL
ncbi:MAG: hypothetical protein ACE5FO_01730 [Parvularculaceae bacterium]